MRKGVRHQYLAVFSAVGHGFIDKYTDEETLSKAVRERMGTYTDASTKTTEKEIKDAIVDQQIRLNKMKPGSYKARKCVERLDNLIKRLEIVQSVAKEGLENQEFYNKYITYGLISSQIFEDIYLFNMEGECE